MVNLKLWLLILPNVVYGQYNTISGTTITSYFERTVHFMSNALRISPTDYLSKFSNAGTSNCAYGSVPVDKLMWQKGLTESSKFHCAEMYNSGGTCFQHDTCPANCNLFGSCAWSSRVWYFYKLTLIGENVAMGFYSPLSVMDAWINSDRHCSNLMLGSFTELGVGANVPYVCQDFGAATTTDYTNPLAMGTHFTPKADSPSASNLYFGAVYSNQQHTPSKIWVQVGTQVFPLSLVYGTTQRGVFAYHLANPAVLGSGCQSYFFKVQDSANNVYRFPETGRFYTYGVNGCQSNYGFQ